jgi:hypothetical protein
MYSLSIDVRDCSQDLQDGYGEHLSLAFLEQRNGFSVLRLGHLSDFYRCTGSFETTMFENYPYCSLSGKKGGTLTLSVFKVMRKCVYQKPKWIPDPNHKRDPMYQMTFTCFNVWEGCWNVSFDIQTVLNPDLVQKIPVWDIVCDELEITKGRMMFKSQGKPSRVCSISNPTSQQFFACIDTGNSSRVNLKCVLWYTAQDHIQLLVHTFFERTLYDSVSQLYLDSVPTVLYTMVRKQP